MLCTVNEEALFASTPDESRLHSFRFRRSRHHGDVCVCIRSFATNQRYPSDPGHPDCGGGTHLALQVRAPAMMTAMTVTQTFLKRASGCGNERETSR
jgi:hypothetical protein